MKTKKTLNKYKDVHKEMQRRGTKKHAHTHSKLLYHPQIQGTNITIHSKDMELERAAYSSL